jgi:hypothetical protein
MSIIHVCSYTYFIICRSDSYHIYITSTLIFWDCNKHAKNLWHSDRVDGEVNPLSFDHKSLSSTVSFARYSRLANEKMQFSELICSVEEVKESIPQWEDCRMWQRFEGHVPSCQHLKRARASSTETGEKGYFDRLVPVSVRTVTEIILASPAKSCYLDPLPKKSLQNVSWRSFWMCWQVQ